MEDLTEKELEEALRIKRNQTKKAKFSNRIVTLVIILNILFTMSILFVFLKTGNEPTVLVTTFFTFTTVELWSLAKIKRAKIKLESEDCEKN